MDLGRIRHRSACERFQSGTSVSTRWNRTSTTSDSSTTVTRQAVVNTRARAETEERPRATRCASDRASPSATARPRWLDRTSTSRSPATCPAGLAKAARAGTRRRAIGGEGETTWREPPWHRRYAPSAPRQLGIVEASIRHGAELEPLASSVPRMRAATTSAADLSIAGSALV
jgi:hypothetical protein